MEKKKAHVWNCFSGLIYLYQHFAMVARKCVEFLVLLSGALFFSLQFLICLLSFVDLVSLDF